MYMCVCVCLCTYMCVCAPAMFYMWRSEDNFSGLLLSCLDGTQALSWDAILDVLGHLSIPKIIFKAEALSLLILMYSSSFKVYVVKSNR